MANAPENRGTATPRLGNYTHEGYSCKETKARETTWHHRATRFRFALIVYQHATSRPVSQLAFSNSIGERRTWRHHPNALCRPMTYKGMRNTAQNRGRAGLQKHPIFALSFTLEGCGRHAGNCRATTRGLAITPPLGEGWA